MLLELRERGNTMLKEEVPARQPAFLLVAMATAFAFCELSGSAGDSQAQSWHQYATSRRAGVGWGDSSNKWLWSVTLW